MLFDYKYGDDSDRPVTDNASGTFEYLNDELGYGSSDEELIFAGQPVAMPGAIGEDVITFDIEMPLPEVVITESASTPASGKDATFWKYSEGKILREVEAYLSGTYRGHYVGAETKVQTLDLIDSIGDAEAFCRSNAIKYLSRFGKKDGKNPKDLLKVIHYAMLLYHFSELPYTEDAVETHSPMGR